MNRIEREKQRSRMKKQIDDIIQHNPEYARRRKLEQEMEVMRAFRTFVLISVDYLERFCGFGNKRINRYLDFVNQSLRYVEELCRIYQSRGGREIWHIRIICDKYLLRI